MNEQCHKVIGDDLDYRVMFDFEPAQKERGPTYDCGGEPGWPAQVIINRIEIRPHGAKNWICIDAKDWDQTSKVWQWLDQCCLDLMLEDD